MTRCLFDSNILVYFLSLGVPQHTIAKELLDKAVLRQFDLYLSIQNLNECFRIVTSNRFLKSPYSPARALTNFSVFEDFSTIIYPNRESHALHKELIQRYQIKGSGVYDNFLVATMLSYDVEILYTANDADFNIYKEIQTLNPFKTR